jgi:hypothetical protein
MLNATRGADTAFVDQLGRGSWGAEVSTHLPRFADGTIVPDAILEGYVDVFPRAALLSGALWFNAPSRRFPETPQCPANTQPHPICDPACETQCAFMPLSRAIMGNHVGYWGSSNGDHIYMGASHAYFLERQAFLLGLKLDLALPDDSAAALSKLKTLRDAVDWWAHRPVYFDKMLLSSVPPGVDARIHRGSDGRCFVTVDNAPRYGAASLRVAGVLYPIPAATGTPALSIIKVPATKCPL